MVQLGHMTVSNSASIKHFKAVCPMTKIMVSNVYPNAKSITDTKNCNLMINTVNLKCKIYYLK